MLIYLIFIHLLLFSLLLYIAIHFINKEKNKNKVKNDQYYEKYLKHKYVDNTLHPNTRLVKWNGVGKVVKNPTLKDLKDEVICITGQFDGIKDRDFAVNVLIDKDINIDTNRYLKTATMWVVGHGDTLGSKKVALIKPTDKIILADDFVKLFYGPEVIGKIKPITTSCPPAIHKIK